MDESDGRVASTSEQMARDLTDSSDGFPTSFIIITPNETIRI